MYKLLSATLLMMILSSCRSAPISPMAVAPMGVSPQFLSASAAQDAVRLVDGFTTVIDKQKVIQKLMHSEITLQDADIYDKQNVFRIEFSKGRANNVIGFLRMYLRPSGVSEIQMVGNYYNNQPVLLSAQETAQILKSATNYPQGSALDQIFKR